MRELVNNMLPLKQMRGWNGSLCTGRKAKQLQKTLGDYKVTILCGFVTLLVFQCTMVGRNFYSPSSATQDLPSLHDKNLGDMSSSSNKELRHMLNVNNQSSNVDEEDSENNDPPSCDSKAPYKLGVEIKDWNEQRALWLSKNPKMAKTANGQKDRILLVSGSQPKPCDNPVADHYLTKTLKNKIDYCRIHNIELFYNLANFDQEMTSFWIKLPLLRKLMLARPEVEWIWWMDLDAMFTDMVFELPLEKYKNHNLVIHGFEDMMANKSWVSLNAGSFLLRNCQWSLDLLDAWAPMGPKGPVRIEVGKLLTKTLIDRPDWEADDQSALIYLILTQSGLWSSKVFLENSFFLSGYWLIIVDKYEEMMQKYHPGYGDTRWPFVTHFTGCQPCKKPDEYNVEPYTTERCLSQMERAFNFADNQVLEHYFGYQHLSLETAKVKRIRKDTLDPLNLHFHMDQEVLPL